MCLAVPGQIKSLRGEGLERTGRIDFGGVTREVALATVPEATIGDFVLVHAGIALTVLDETAAAESLKLLDSIDQEAISE